MTKTIRSNNTLTIAFGSMQNYKELIRDSGLLIIYVIHYLKTIHFELIHRDGCCGGFHLTGFTTYTRKRNGNLLIWRIQCPHCKKTWSILPEFALRYTGLPPAKAWKCLYNSYYGASLEVNSSLFGVPVMQSYNYICAIGRNNLVKMLTNCGLPLPKYLISDEKHAKCQSEAVYLPTIVSGRVLWHLGYCESLSETSLTENYGIFKESAQKILPGYSPDGTLSDGFTSTQNSMSNNYEKATKGICLFHASLLINRKLKKQLGGNAETLSKKFFNIIARFNEKELLAVFKVGQRIRRFKEELNKVAGDAAADIIDWINRKKAGWMKTMQIKDMPKTTTLLDQVHNMIDRKLFMMKQFHHNKGRQNQYINGYALLYNIIPYQRRAKNAELCAIQVENGKVPSKNWMLNIQILTSGGYQLINSNTT